MSRPTSTINVRDQPYGAIGDGTTDDTNAFEQALLDGQTYSLPVLVPAGIYRITRTLNLNTCLIGQGRYLSILKGDFAGLILKPFRNLDIRYLGFTSTATVPDHATTSGIDMASNGVHECILDSLSFVNLKQAIVIGGLSWSNSFRDIIILNCGTKNDFALECVPVDGDGVNTSYNDLLFDRLEITGGPDWPGKGGSISGYGVSFNQLHVESVWHEQGFVFNAENCVVNGGYFEVPKGEWNMNQLLIKQTTLFIGAWIACKVDTQGGQAVLNCCRSDKSWYPYGNISASHCGGLDEDSWRGSIEALVMADMTRAGGAEQSGPPFWFRPRTIGNPQVDRALFLASNDQPDSTWVPIKINNDYLYAVTGASSTQPWVELRWRSTRYEWETQIWIAAQFSFPNLFMKT